MATTRYSTETSYTLAPHILNLTLLGIDDLRGFGNIADNTITGNTGGNRLNGGKGDDTLIGGLGNDTYVIDSSQDVVTEKAGEGRDRVRSSITTTLGEHLEDLVLLGAADLHATGNAANNVLLGNAGNNLLNGQSGRDFLRTGGGIDTLLGEAGRDTFHLVDSDISALRVSGSSPAMHVDGGAGWDTLRLNTSTGSLLDLVAVASATGSDTTRLQNIQTVDLSSSGAQQVALTSANVVAMGAANVLNSGNAAGRGWSDGTYSLQASEARVQVVIEGTAQDALVASALGGSSDEWIAVGTLSHAGRTYNVGGLKSEVQHRTGLIMKGLVRSVQTA